MENILDIRKEVVKYSLLNLPSLRTHNLFSWDCWASEAWVMA
jgi:hypothetical protein